MAELLFTEPAPASSPETPLSDWRDTLLGQEFSAHQMDVSDLMIKAGRGYDLRFDALVLRDKVRVWFAGLDDVERSFISRDTYNSMLYSLERIAGIDET